MISIDVTEVSLSLSTTTTTTHKKSLTRNIGSASALPIISDKEKLKKAVKILPFFGRTAYFSFKNILRKKRGFDGERVKECWSLLTPNIFLNKWVRRIGLTSCGTECPQKKTQP